MPDVHNKATRSYNMSRIRSTNTKPEILVRKFLHAKGFRFRIHDKKLPSKPDIVLSKYKTIILIHGCFWHGHNKCSKAPLPETNKNYWIDKIKKNRTKDKQAIKQLKLQGWRVITIWQCELSNEIWKQNLLDLLQLNN